MSEVNREKYENLSSITIIVLTILVWKVMTDIHRVDNECYAKEPRRIYDPNALKRS